MNRENKIGQLIANQTGRMVAAWENLEVRKVIIDEQELDATGSYFIVLEDVTYSENRDWFIQDLLDESDFYTEQKISFMEVNNMVNLIII